MMTDLQFTKCARLFEKLKIIYGPDFVNSTLFRHKKLNLALRDYAKTALIDLEGEILSGGSQNELNDRNG